MHMSPIRSRLLVIIEILQKFREIESHLKFGRVDTPRRTLEIFSAYQWL